MLRGREPPPNFFGLSIFIFLNDSNPVAFVRSQLWTRLLSARLYERTLIHWPFRFAMMRSTLSDMRSPSSEKKRRLR